MLTIRTGHRFDRRDFLTIGGMGLGGLAWSGMGGHARAAEQIRFLTGKSVVFLFQQGGPSQFETYDPKPEAPSEIRTVTDVIPTSVAGVHFGSKFPQLAKLAHRLTIVRSFQTNNGGHNISPIVGPDSLNANIGSLFSRMAGATRPETGIPTNTVVFPDAVCHDVLKGKARGEIAASGSLGAVHSPFMPGGNGELQQNLKLNVSESTLANRRELTAKFNSVSRRLEGSVEFQQLDELQQQALQVLLGGNVAKALDLSLEDSTTVARYDTRQYESRDGWSKVARGRAGMYTGHARALGKQLLLARRLCEAGCGYVTIHDGYDGVWDMHADGNNLNMADGMEACGPAFDHAVTAFIEDLESRGLSDKIMLVCTGEMGRTPKLNKNGGRDHWPRLAPLLMYGGGITPSVIGRSTKDGGEPAADPFNNKNLIATILRTLCDPGQLRLVSELAAISRLADIKPIPVWG